MRVATIAACVLLATLRVAHAETAEELRIRGETLANNGRYSEAIDAFKAAELKEHRSRHACLIGLAYERREAYSQAEIYLDQCKAGASTADPLPEWAPEAFRVLAAAIAKQQLVAVLVMASPPEARISVSTFAPDDTFEARTLHLAPGKYTFTARAPGYADRTEEVEVKDQAGAAVSFNLEHRVEVETDIKPRASKVPWVVIGGGVALGVAGGVVHAFLFANDRSKLEDAYANHDPTLYADYSSKFDRDRLLTIGLYSAGAIAIATGVILRATVYKPPVEVAITPTHGGGLLVLDKRF